LGEWNKKRVIMQRYDLTASIYDMRYLEEQTAKIKAVIESINIAEESLVLDLGCGTGLLFDYVAEKAKIVVGLDISGKILFQAEERARKFLNVHLLKADAENIPLKEAFFSHVFAITLIQNTPNLFETLNEIKRVAKKNSTIVITGLKRKFQKETFERMLLDAGLHIATSNSEGLKCYVAICTKIFH